MTFAICVLFMFGIFARSSADLASEHSFFAALDESEAVKLYWNVSTDKEKEITFTVQAETTGWIGFGISSGQGRMKGADIVIGWIKDGKAFFSDRHALNAADGHVMPRVDSRPSDYELISLKEENDKTTMTFKRKILTCDPQDNRIEEGTTKVIYAYHPEDPSSENSISRHNPHSRGAKSLMLLNTREKIPSMPSDVKTFDFLNNKTALPSDDTVYWCKVFEFPKLQKRHDIIKIEPIIQKGHESIVHHMLLYECKDDIPRSNLTYESRCYSPDMPPAIRECSGVSIIAGWAIGGESFYFPDDVGFPIGSDDSPKVSILEVHYDNPEGKSDIVDSSGFRFYYTSQLRKYEAAILTTGWDVSSSMVIPPGQASWLSKGFCVQECTAEGLKDSTLPGGGIKIFASALHTHLAGRAAYVQHIRGGVELPPIVRDNHYDFNFQEFQILEKEVHVLPGDSMVTVCNYETKDRKTLTTGGFSTREEMCLSFHVYYPKVNLTTCLSKQRPAILAFVMEHFGNGTHITKPFPPEVWTSDLITDLRKTYDDTKSIRASCNGIKSIHLPVEKYRNKPVIKEAYKFKSECEEVSSGCVKVLPGAVVFAAIFVMFIFSSVF